jgi:hypothetical protein
MCLLMICRSDITVCQDPKLAAEWGLPYSSRTYCPSFCFERWWCAVLPLVWTVDCDWWRNRHTRSTGCFSWRVHTNGPWNQDQYLLSCSKCGGVILDVMLTRCAANKLYATWSSCVGRIKERERNRVDGKETNHH